MATNRVVPLDDSLAYLTCPICESNGTPDVPMTRELHICRCPLGHLYSSISEALNRGAKMVPLPLNEQPPVTSVKMTMWVHPRIKQALETRYRGRLIATTDVLLSALADGNVLIMAGADVAKLKKLGLNNGAQIVASIESSAQMEKERQQLMDKLAQYESVFRAAGIGQ